MKRLYLLTLISWAALVVACGLLPDRVYVEANESPLSGTTWQDQVGGEDPVLGVGVEWDLKPTRVIIEGQREAHPWDFGSMLGIYDGADTQAPTPITVVDEALTARVDALVVSNEILASENAELAEDMRAIRETTDLLKSILTWLTAGGGATVASLLGFRAVRKSREPQILEEQ